MKIAFIGGRDIHKLGGIENYMYNLATKLVEFGHEPIVYCESNRNYIEWINGFKVVHHRSVGGRFFCKIILSYKSTIQSIFSKDKADIYHYNAWPPSLASWIPRLFGRKAILQGHGLEWKRTKYSSAQQKVMRFMEMITAKMHKNIIMVSQEQTDYFFASYNKKCITIPTAVNMPSDSINSDITSNLGLNNYGYFLYLGRLVQDKNPDYLVKAYIKSGINNIKLVIAGSNDANKGYVEYLHNLAADNPNIIFTGAVYGVDKEMLLKHCFAFCIPSTLEGLPITLLEAMSYKKLCLASDIAANREALGDSGVWCGYENTDDLSEKLCYIIDNCSELEWQKEYNYNRINEAFTWDTVSKQYEQYILLI